MLTLLIYTYFIGSILSTLLVLSELNKMKEDKSLTTWLSLMEHETTWSRKTVMNMLFVTAILFSWFGVIASIDLKLNQ